MSFELQQQKCKFENLNPRPELNGEEPRSAADLKFSANMDGDVLAFFAPELRAFLFCKNGGGDLVDATQDAPDLRFPDMSYPIAWAHEVIGATIEIDYGVGGRSNIKIGDCKVNAFRIEPQQGGTVVVTFRVQAHPDDKATGKLYNLIGRDVDITLTPPETQDLIDRQGAGNGSSEQAQNALA